MNGHKEELLIRSLGIWYRFLTFKIDTIKAHSWFFSVYVCVVNTVATLYQQYSKRPPKILEEREEGDLKTKT